MKTITRCLTVQEASRVRLFLDSIGIEAFIPDEVTGLMVPNEFFHGPGVRVQVSDEQFAEAEEALKEFDADAGQTIARLENG